MPLPQWPKTLLDALLNWGFEPDGYCVHPYMVHATHQILVFDRHSHPGRPTPWMIAWVQDEFYDAPPVHCATEHEVIQVLSAYFAALSANH